MQKMKCLGLSRTEVKTQSEIPSCPPARTKSKTPPTPPLAGTGGGTRDVSTTRRDLLFLRTTINSTNIQWTARHMHILETWFNSLCTWENLPQTYNSGTSSSNVNTHRAIKSNCSITCSSPIATIALELEMEGAWDLFCVVLFPFLLWKYLLSRHFKYYEISLHHKQQGTRNKFTIIRI